MAEMVCFKWDDFDENVKSSFGSLREDNDFTDVTLACEDGQQFEAHKVILASSSPFFQNILKGIKHTHPFLYLSGMKGDELSAILDFLYCGEANVDQKNLESFLVIAEQLQLIGLMGERETESRIGEKTGNKIFAKRSPSASIFTEDKIDLKNFAKKVKHERNENLAYVAIANLQTEKSQAAELEKKVQSMMEKSSNLIANGKMGLEARASICKACGKEGLGRNIKKHIEANHLEGLYSHPCNLCQKTCKSRDGLWQHKRTNHKNVL